MFVRHALPGERVRVVVTDGHDGSKFWRADAVEVRRAVAGPGRAALPVGRPRAGAAAATGSTRRSPAQRALKAAVVREQLSRLAGLRARRRGRGGAGRRATGSAGGPGCSSPSTTTGRPGLRRHRSHEVVPVDQCRIAHPLVDEAGRHRPPLAGACVGRGRGVGRRPATGWCCRTAAAHGALTEVGGGTRSLPGHRRRLLAGAPGGGRDPAGRGARAGSSRSRASRRWTSTAASGCSRPSWPRGSGRPAGSRRWRPTGSPSRTPGTTSPGWPAYASSAAGSTTCCAGCGWAGPTSSSSTRRARAPAARSSTCCRASGPARDRLRRLRPGGAGARPALLRRARLPAGRAAGVRPVPDDRARRVRRRAGTPRKLNGEPDARRHRRVLVSFLCTKHRSPCPPS